MPYIGRGPSKSGSFRIIDDISSSFNGSTVAFTLQVNSSNLTVGQEQTLFIALDGVIQEPKSAYTIAGSTITFASAPATGVSFWGVELGDVGGIADAVTSNAFTGQTDLGEAPATGDTLLVYDTSASSLKEMTIANLFTSPAIAGGTFSGSFTGTMDITGTVLSGASPLVFEGATADAHETTLAFTDPTADRTITFPNDTGTVSLTGATETLAAKTLTTPTIASTGWTNATHAHAANNSGGTLDAAAIGAGTVATARLGSGTANNTVFLRGDGTWAAPASGASAAGNSGSVQFSDGSSGLLADNGQLHWDASNNRLGIGTASPAKPLHISLGSSGGSARATSFIVLEDDTTDEIGIQFLMPGTSGTPQQSIFFGDAADGTRGSIIYDHIDDAFRIQAGGSGSQMTITGGSTGYVSSKGLAVLLKRGSTQTISDNTNTSVEWDGTLYDDFSMHNPSANNGERIVMPVAGYYLVGAMIGWQSTSNSTGLRRIIITKNGATVATNRYNPASGEDPRHECTIMEYFSANQYATVQVFQNCGTGLTIDANVSRFWAVKVG